MDFATIDWSQIGAGLIGLGVIIKGIVDYSAKAKGKVALRGCLYGDTAHEELNKKLDDIYGILCKHVPQSTETHDWMLIVKTLMEAKK